MRFEDIKHKSTAKCVINLKIDIEQFKDYDELKVYIKKNRLRLYRQLNAEYFKTYMRKRYQPKEHKEPKESKEHKQQPDIMI